MPKYIVTQYELHANDFEVEANSAAEAIEAVLINGDGESENGSELLESADLYGCIDSLDPIYQECKRLGIIMDNDKFIPSIRGVEEMKE